ncbi:peroxiredoxin [Saccharolobus islandicus]|uniref:thioredoxin-dependent peroxiredoxin n=5 Tax=Saccharolobus islandicus TaxID=43080 RepID=M9U638_SACIS|nr:peroxiredoxin [Sulfolobus islandicus]ACP36960.1 alkyl hydroperoxide reductase/ Thiol specific antioxidant/ Mal allergen [Sulfolobus islandicus M.14.25]ACP54097.1 alkyl hydroperoxide reductase/ Thiol specific antioxidant/ Mal allergen [Sulfolobus islandicus M.16.27]ACR40704.1 alkyl hydroperoxide reductase/ Thiol specific antioxidant/ Mal allergen [Sulfolobus islandicus M.16.4]ADX81440.1 peroxiredoxin family, PRX [Sulfolobus islandicus HVE10/4]AGJ61548.1 Peroxiredoxin [Sulfolobus islandicus L
MNVGEEAPDFEAESTLGKIKLSDFRGKKVILYFYPKSFTSGCTRELQRFTELYDEFKKLNAEVIGVSVDKIDTQKKFAEKYGAKFPIVADAQKTISKLYSVLNERGTSAQRVTFIIDENGKIVDILKNLKKAEEHADKSLEIIKKQNST